MKAILISFFLLANSLNLASQALSTEAKNVFTAKKIIFYGYDFTRFHLADAKRGGQDIKKYIFELTGLMSEHIPEKKLSKWLNKDTTTFDFNSTFQLNKKINNDDIVVPVNLTLSKDSLQSMIDKYSSSIKQGIGYVIIFECFDNSSKTVSAYSIYFDITTREILMTEHITHRDSNNYNRLSDWNSAAIQVVKALADTFRNKLETNKK